MDSYNTEKFNLNQDSGILRQPYDWLLNKLGFGNYSSTKSFTYPWSIFIGCKYSDELPPALSLPTFELGFLPSFSSACDPSLATQDRNLSSGQYKFPFGLQMRVCVCVCVYVYVYVCVRAAHVCVLGAVSS